MITQKQKNNIIHIMRDRMNVGDIMWLSDFLKEEREYIINIIATQKYQLPYCFTLNGTASDPSTHTKFRKEVNHFYV